MSRRVIGVVIGLAVVFCGVAEAQFVSAFHVIPVVAKIKGNAGTDWVSDASVSNVSNGTVDVTAMFFPEATSNNFPLFGKASASYQFTLQAGRTLVVNDVIASWFPAQGDNIKGVLVIVGELAIGGNEGRLAVATRTYNNADPSKTYGQGIGSGLFSLVWGSGKSVITGIRQDSRFRSNIGVVNFGPQTLTVYIDIYDANGALVDQKSKTVESFSSRQFSMDRDLGVNNIAAGRVEVYVDPATITWDPCSGEVPGLGLSFGAFIAYLSKVDGGSGDGEFSFGLSDWTEYVVDCGEDPSECG